MTDGSFERLQDFGIASGAVESGPAPVSASVRFGLIAHVIGKAKNLSATRHSHVLLDRSGLRNLRHSRLMSQQELADDCWRRNIQLSLTTIKRAELGRPVRFRIAREFARCFGVTVLELIRVSPLEAGGSSCSDAMPTSG
ncbi:hypothetical protein C7S18_06370 [Ahniella affigens]|uniref:HTH cro/C1-type domain-containing protein n=1 Tax=Ahniella affigens TaxID=2021234 RepID=A0A2P1PPU9_9GAMM|nr:helix-turn-helix transcriptional regulator [Ahniella affigens]AVP96848.1 hypothetical protein C7S18_06370 [Ahniella affigens]